MQSQQEHFGAMKLYLGAIEARFGEDGGCGGAGGAVFGVPKPPPPPPTKILPTLSVKNLLRRCYIC